VISNRQLVVLAVAQAVVGLAFFTGRDRWHVVFLESVH
jgi:hypothetical protein